MPRDSRVPRLDPDDNDELRRLAKGIASIAAKRCAPDATYEERRRASVSVMADAMWLDEEAALEALVTTAERIEVDGEIHQALKQPSTTTYHGLWGTHVVDEPLYRKEGVRNGPTLKPLECKIGSLGSLLPDAGRVFGLLRASMTSVDIERTLQEMGYRPPGRAYIEKHVAQLASEVSARIVELEAAARSTEAAAEMKPAAAVTAGLDRMAVCMNEVLPEGAVREERPPRKKPYARTPPPPAEHNWRMAWVASVTEVDEYGAVLRTRRYGTDAQADRGTLAARVIEDIKAVVARNPGIPVATIQDGAKDLSTLPKGLDAAMSDDDLAALPDKLLVDVPHSDVFHLTDFHHTISYLDEVVRLCEPRCDPHNMKQWYRTVLLHDDNGVDTVIRNLRRRIKKLPSGKSLAAAKKALRYIRKRRKTMQYAAARRRGLPVGSGATESTCALFQLSVKRPGAAWSAPGLRGVMTLRGLVLSERWGPAWDAYAGGHRRRVTRTREPHRAHRQHAPALRLVT